MELLKCAQVDQLNRTTNSIIKARQKESWRLQLYLHFKLHTRIHCDLGLILQRANSAHTNLFKYTTQF